jgi:predicted RNA binding protein YcfA (HicA-like mRNA interferase family)
MTARQICSILVKHGWEYKRTHASHHVYGKAGFRPITVPFHHNGNVDLGDFGKRILHEAGIEG